MDYHVVAQGKTTIPGVDDGEELGFTDVRVCCTLSLSLSILLNRFFKCVLKIWIWCTKQQEEYQKVSKLLKKNHKKFHSCFKIACFSYEMMKRVE